MCISSFLPQSWWNWNLTMNSDDPEAKKIAIEEAGDCPSGRLVAWDKKTGKEIEPEFGPSIGVVEDKQAGAIGPLRCAARSRLNPPMALLMKFVIVLHSVVVASLAISLSAIVATCSDCLISK